YGSLGEHPGVERCDRAGCRMIFSGPVGTISVSPDDKRLAFTTIDNSGAAVRWMWSDGSGSVHVVTDTQNVCGPIWASNKNLWVSLRKGHQEVWTEIDTDRERSTGRTSPASNGCADGYPDPLRPLHESVELEVNFRSQLRLLPSKYLPASEQSR